jgi:hypothetical protein
LTTPKIIEIREIQPKIHQKFFYMLKYDVYFFSKIFRSKQNISIIYDDASINIENMDLEENNMEVVSYKCKCSGHQFLKVSPVVKYVFFLLLPFAMPTLKFLNVLAHEISLSCKPHRPPVFNMHYPN